MWPTPLHPVVGQPCPGAVNKSLEPAVHTHTQLIKLCTQLQNHFHFESNIGSSHHIHMKAETVSADSCGIILDPSPKKPQQTSENIIQLKECLTIRVL